MTIHMEGKSGDLSEKMAGIEVRKEIKLLNSIKEDAIHFSTQAY